MKSKNKLLSIFYAFAILCSISCDNRSSGKNNHLVDDMKIFSAVIDTIAVHIRPPSLWPASPPQHRFKKVLTWEDSIMYNKNMIKFIFIVLNVQPLVKAVLNSYFFFVLSY